MKTHQLRVNQLSAGAYDWYQHYLHVLDAKDIDKYAEFLADECVLQMNNADPMRGKEAIVQGLAAYWQSFGSLEHHLLNIYGSDSNFVLEALNHYERLDGRQVTLRAVAFTDRNEQGLVVSVRIYSDVSPLFAP
jgi:ketosteroid isomerase-like protein